jgi:hypothetical protein
MVGSSNRLAFFCFFSCLFSIFIVSSVPPASATPPTFSTLPILPAPAVEVERLEKLDKRIGVDGFSAAFRGRKLCVVIRHVRGIGRAKLTLKHLFPKGGSSVPATEATTSSSSSSSTSTSSSSTSQSLQVEVRFLNFAMLEGFTVGSGSSEIFSLPTSRAKTRKFLLKVPLSSNSAIIDLAWVDAYRN